MAKGKESFDRRARERNKKAKADAKREERLARGVGGEEEAGGADVVAAPPRDDTPILDALARLHADYDDKKISFDDFEERRADLLSQLTVD